MANGWAVPVIDAERSLLPKFYVAHFGVYRPESASTPLRIVFDPSIEFKGVSLNSVLRRGPNLIGDLFGVLLRFRMNYVAIVGDIAKMFLQIRLCLVICLLTVSFGEIWINLSSRMNICWQESSLETNPLPTWQVT